MKIENLKRAQRLDEQLNQCVLPAIEKINKLLVEKNRNSLRHEATNGKGLYSFYLSEYSDGSGNIDLTNCAVGIEILKFTKELLLKKQKEIEAEIALL